MRTGGRVLRAAVLGSAAAAALLPAGGCATSIRKGLLSGNPLDRARAAVAAAEQRDAKAIPILVSLLDDRDPGVRMYTILALERLTGQTYGYRFYDEPVAREAAVQRWRAAVQAGQVHLRAPDNPVADAAVPSGGGGP